jgi:hypothetical protein
MNPYPQHGTVRNLQLKIEKEFNLSCCVILSKVKAVFLVNNLVIVIWFLFLLGHAAWAGGLGRPRPTVDKD